MPPRRKANERTLLQALARVVRSKRSSTPGIVIGVGDDAAVVRPPANQDLIVTTDVHVEGQHFRREWFRGTDLGWRLAAVNLSDVAAMGGKPLYGVLSLMIPANVEERYVTDIERGVCDHLAAYGATVIGGNVSRIADTLVCDLTMIGGCAKNRTWRRLCRPGQDAIVVVGYLGDATAGLKTLSDKKTGRGYSTLLRAFKRPAPLLGVASLLREENAIHGAIDVSDGFSTDLAHLCEPNDAGAEVQIESLPISSALEKYCRVHKMSAIECALHGGEDYALILSVDAKKADAVVARIEKTLDVPARVVGTFTRAKRKYHTVDATGRRKTLKPLGWDHFIER